MHRFMLLLVVAIAAPASASPDPWAAWTPLLGTWRSDTPALGTGSFTLEKGLQGRVLVRTNHAEVPKSADRPASTHDDLMIIHVDDDGKTRADYYDNEGHVIRYDVVIEADAKRVVFTSASTATSPGYRLGYDWSARGSLSFSFDIARPGGSDFKPYLTGKLVRKT